MTTRKESLKKIAEDLELQSIIDKAYSKLNDNQDADVNNADKLSDAKKFLHALIDAVVLDDEI